MVWIRHPRIDDGQRVVEVPDESLPHHQRAGWEVTDPPEAPPATDTDTSQAPEPPGLSNVRDEPPRHRRAARKDA